MRDSAAPIVLSCWIALAASALSIGLAPPHVSSLASPSAADRRAPQRVVIFPPLLAAYLTIDKAADHLLAAPEGERREIAKGALRHYFSTLDRLSSVPTLGANSAIPSDPEQVLLLSPDRVVVWAWAAGGLDRLGLPIAAIAQTGIAESWRAIGAITHNSARTEEILDAFDRRLQALADETSASTLDGGRRVIVLWEAGQNLWRIALGGNRHTPYLRGLGVEDLTPLFPGLAKTLGSTVIGVETLLKLNPQAIFLTCCGSPDDLPQKYYESPYFHSLTAVRENRVYKEPKGGARMDGAVEWPLLMRWYAELLVPTSLERKLRGQWQEVYTDFYGFAPDDEELDDMLRNDENAHSLNYGRFTRTGG
ncbi:ABC transporter substrate-binding protein [Methylocystis heyeri]|uniref:ABC transporter substrate-binding protein n=1 Tax=Methylocystis heyeri TaxID=391905 RepID=A0A6B8KCW6_9HYPH|nr:ABC transporter substrate-binding protein [Methylocystis heyeri]QGM44290.1 ABC transporter substrate-binding protein [Methylocystis heyeri]